MREKILKGEVIQLKKSDKFFPAGDVLILLEGAIIDADNNNIRYAGVRLMPSEQHYIADKDSRIFVIK